MAKRGRLDPILNLRTSFFGAVQFHLVKDKNS